MKDSTYFGLNVILGTFCSVLALLGIFYINTVTPWFWIAMSVMYGLMSVWFYRKYIKYKTR